MGILRISVGRYKFSLKLCSAKLITFLLLVYSGNLYSQYSVLKSLSNCSLTGCISKSGLILIDSLLYGTCSFGGASNAGVIFSYNLNTSEYKVLHEFNGTDGEGPRYLTYYNNLIYGVGFSGGLQNSGTIYRIEPGGNNFTKLFDFDGINTGSNLSCKLFPYNDSLYGLSMTGGKYNVGTMFRFHKNGTGLQVLLSFNDSLCANPLGEIEFDGEFMYFVTQNRVDYKCKISRVRPDGTGLINLYKIDNNGGVSSAGIRLHGDCIYGFSSPAGSDKLGIIFKLQKDGSGFSVIHNFALANGANPKGSPLILDSVLYGVTENGGRANLGVLFEYDLRKDKLLVLHNFLPKTTEHPYRSLLLIDSAFYGTCFGTLGGIYKYQYYKTPKVQVYDIKKTAEDSGIIKLSWRNGNGTNRAVFIKQADTGFALPAELITYSDSSFFMKGSQIDSSGWYCVYNGTDSTVKVTGLDSTRNFRVMVCEYNGVPGTERYLLDKASDNPITFYSNWTRINNENVSAFVYPNPVFRNLNVHSGNVIHSIEIYDVTGREVYSVTCMSADVALDVSAIPAGIYFVRISGVKYNETRKIIITK